MGVKQILKKIVPKVLLEYYKTFLSFLVRSFNVIKYKSLINDTYCHYECVKEKIKSRSDKKLRFGAYVIFDSTFAAYDLFSLLLANDNAYSAKIVVIPDISRGIQHMKQQYQSTKDFFINKYGETNVLDGWNEDTDEFIDNSSLFDVIYLSNPYDHMVNSVHGISYLSKQNVLPIYLSYGCMPDNYGCKVIMPMKEISLFWKVFADNEMSYKDYCKFELAKGKNVVLSGYAKMDSLVKFSKKKYDKKRIIIAPHHTINNSSLPLSNFIEYQDFYLELPKLFPQIEFIFRPHPLLFINMVNNQFWTQEYVNTYISKIQESGMIYSVGGDYFDVFVNSDAIIHDCSSFVVEYLYTGKPCCFMAKRNYKKIFSLLGKECLKNYYLAYNKEQIIDFIQNVVIENKDILVNSRQKFGENKLAINYPNVSELILKEISIF